MSPAPAATDDRAIADFYRGKTVTLIVGLAAGGGYDTISRLIARSIGKHIPGNPTVVVQNMPGAGALVAVNHTYNTAPADGTVLVNFPAGLLTQQILGASAVRFDAAKLSYVGVPIKDTSICVATADSGLRSLGDTVGPNAKEFIAGGAAPGNTLEDEAKVLREALGAKIRIVSGYGGTNPIRLAMAQGEVHGMCGWSWESLKTSALDEVQSGKVVVLSQNVDEKHPDLPQVPLARDFAQTDEARQLLRYGITLVSERQRIYALPPGVPVERVRALQTAFMRVMSDPELIEGAARANLEMNPISGEETQRRLQELLTIPPTIKERLIPIWRPQAS